MSKKLSSFLLLLLSTALICVLVIVFFHYLKAQTKILKVEEKQDFETTVSVPNLEIPKLKPNETLISHTGFSLVYNEEHEQANWVAYYLCKTRSVKKADRSNKFLLDSKILTGSANDADYKGSGYDRGHLCPAADMAWSKITMNESFYYSNMSPQTPSFNRGVWKKLEELVRNWATTHDTIYVVTGPVFTESMTTIGKNNVAVPKYYYKVILDYKQNRKQGIGFLLPNEASSLSLANFVVTIDSVEKATGIDFYHILEDKIEEAIESKSDFERW